MRVLCAVVMLVSAGLAAADITTGTCPTVVTKPNFNPTDFLGRWFEIERFPTEFEDGMDCVTADSALLEDSYTKFYLNFTGDVGPELLKRLVGMGELTTNNGEFNVSLEDAPNMFMEILDTDYTVYGSVYACNQIEENKMDQYAWLISRTDSLTEDQKKLAMDAFESNNIDVDLLAPTRQGGDCLYVPF